MKAWAVIRNEQPLQCIEMASPVATGSEVVLDVTRCGVCHSDLHFWHGSYNMGGGKVMSLADRGVTRPRAPGHEITGRVVAVGQELYDLVWSESMRTFAKCFSISDVALAKTCRHMHVPTPPQGYWNKKAAGKPALRLELPPRPVGIEDWVVLAGGRFGRYRQHSISQEEILGPVPPASVFNETLEDVRKRLDVILPKVMVPKNLGMPPPAVAKLLKRDDEKRKRQESRSYISTRDTPLYDTPFQRRRLRLLSAIFLALAKQGCRADTWGSHPVELH